MIIDLMIRCPALDVYRYAPLPSSSLLLCSVMVVGRELCRLLLGKVVCYFIRHGSLHLPDVYLCRVCVLLVM